MHYFVENIPKNFANYEIVSIFAHLFEETTTVILKDGEAQVVKLVDTLL